MAFQSITLEYSERSNFLRQQGRQIARSICQSKHSLGECIEIEVQIYQVLSGKKDNAVVLERKKLALLYSLKGY
jgi:hypothetical protein